MKKIMCVFGTRAEAIKMVPVIKAIDHDDNFNNCVVVTGQHDTMLYQVLDLFNIKPDYDLKIMSVSQTLNQITINILDKLEPIIQKENPDIVLVHGDTTTTFSAALAAFYKKIPIAHVEAGLRTGDKYSPFPEEMNRKITDYLSDLYFTPTVTTREYLYLDKCNEQQIFVTGNTAIDVMKYTNKKKSNKNFWNKIINKKIILVTMHRRENQGRPISEVCRAIEKIIKNNDDVEVIFPLHKNPNVRKIVIESFDNLERIHLIEPLGIFEFHDLMSKCYLILTDSGGIQEEAPFFNKPVLILRDTTERPEGLKTGALKLIGTSEENVYREVDILLKNEKEYDLMAYANNPYGDGKAAERILGVIKYYFGLSDNYPDEFSFK